MAEHTFDRIVCVKLVVRVKLLPTPVQVAALAATLHACNEAAEYTSRVAFERNVKSRNELQKLCYHDIKDRFGLSAQPAVRVVKKVVDAYTTLQAAIRAGNLGGEKSRRRVRAESKPISFRRWAAQPFDGRCLSWQLDARTVSIWTTAGRVKDLRFACSPDQLTTLRAHRQGESDLLFCDGRWFLIATCEVPEPEVFEPAGWPFHQLEQHLTYKARRAGVPVLLVDARYTSQMCPRCKHTSRSNRPTRDRFSCRRCGLAGPADVVAAVNIRDRARRAWVLVNVPLPAAA